LAEEGFEIAPQGGGRQAQRLRDGMARAALLGLLEVVLGPLWAWLGAGEQPSGATLQGGALVLAALALNELAAFRSRRA
jgi:drug/metabolite transporter (DMT)-like permease